MPWLLLGGLVVLVIYMARKTPDVDPARELKQQLGPDMSVTARSASYPQSPAMAAGNPMMSGSNLLRLGTNYKITSQNQNLVAPALTVGQTATAKNSMGPTDAESSVPTEAPRPLPGYKLPGIGLVVNNTSPTTRKL